MPLIPGINQAQIKADPANTPYFSIRASDDEFGGNIGTSMLSLGKELHDDSEVVAKLRPKDEKTATDSTQAGQKGDSSVSVTGDTGGTNPVANADVSNAIDLVNGFNGNAFSLQSGFFGLNGKEAVDLAPDVLDRLGQLQSDTLAGASSPRSASLAQPALAKWSQVLTGNIERHAAAQQQVYDHDLDETQIAQSREAVGLLYNDDRTFLVQLQVAAEARADQVARQMAADGAESDGGQVATAISGARAKIASDLVATRIAAAVDQGDIVGALGLHRRWHHDLLPQDHRPVTQLLAAGTFMARINDVTSRILASRQSSSG